MRKHVVLALKGMAYGMTHIVPALGGGTILILLGIYEQFVDACGNLLNRKRWREILPFLLVLGAGMVIGMVGLSNVIEYLLTHYRIPTMFFFIGLLLGTIPSILTMHNDMRFTLKRAVALVFGVVAVILLRFVRESAESALIGISLEIKDAGSFAYYVVTSFLAGAASVTPGMDGTSVFMLAGTFKPIIEAVSALSRLDIHWATIIATALGVVPGIILFSKFVDWAIKRAPAVVYYCVLGIIGGSAYGLWPKGMSNVDMITVIVAIITFLGGGALALIFNKPTQSKEA